METNVISLIGSPLNEVKGKLRKASILKLYKYLFIKIFASISTFIITFLSILFSVVAPIVFFVTSTSIYSLVSSIQFYVLIFYCIFLFLFILLITIRLFGNQVEDNTFLLVLTKPYSRASIILTQYLVISISALLLIVVSLVIQIVIGNIFMSSVPMFLSFYNMTILKLFGFLLLFSFLLISSVALLATIFQSKTVFLIFSIFCSLFILGGLPYNLYKEKIDANEFMLNGSPVFYRDMESAINYKNSIANNLLAYPNLSKDIFHFLYNSAPDEQTNYDNTMAYNKPGQQEARLVHYLQSGLLVSDATPKLIHIQNVTFSNWSGSTPDFINKPGSEMYIYQVKRFLTPPELREAIAKQKNPTLKAIQQDVLKLYTDWLAANNNDLNGYMANQFTRVDQLLSFDASETSQDWQDPSHPPMDQNISCIAYKDANGKAAYYVPDSDTLVQIYVNQQQFAMDAPSLKQYTNEIFRNPIFYVVRAFEDSVHAMAKTLALLDHDPLQNTNIWERYRKLVDQYAILDKINVFEHFNQLWTWMLGTYGDFKFDLKFSGEMDFTTQLNSFFSYPLKSYNLNETGNIDYANASTIQNNIAVVIAYLVLGCIFLGANTVAWKLKKIS